MVYPNAVYTHTAKYLFSDNYHQAIKTVEDICGGSPLRFPLTGTGPTRKHMPFWKSIWGAKTA